MESIGQIELGACLGWEIRAVDFLAASCYLLNGEGGCIVFHGAYCFADARGGDESGAAPPAKESCLMSVVGSRIDALTVLEDRNLVVHLDSGAQLVCYAVSSGGSYEVIVDGSVLASA